MVQYIYFVKCPNCEDEHFDFFDEAKEFALSCLGSKPIITQTEVCRNDFGECTDSSDLGTVWSWEDEFDVADDDTGVSVFTKGDFADYNPDNDPEFDALDNSVDYEPTLNTDDTAFHSDDSLDQVPDNFRKPIPDGMTVEDLVEEMEENEDTVECTWCNDLFDKSECRYEVDLGYLCSRCEAAIKSRGEPLTFRENNYWDFLDEALPIEPDFSEVIESTDMEIWGIEPATDGDYKAVLYKRINDVTFQNSETQKVVDEMYSTNNLFTFFYNKKGVPECYAWNVDLLRSLSGRNIEFEDDRYEDALEAVDRRLSNIKLTEASAESLTWICLFDGKEVGTVEAATEDEALEKMQQEYPEYNYGEYDGCFEVFPDVNTF